MNPATQACNDQRLFFCPQEQPQLLQSRVTLLRFETYLGRFFVALLSSFVVIYEQLLPETRVAGF